ncbi:unnamed protein product, partial [Mycena citricolor]
MTIATSSSCCSAISSKYVSNTSRYRPWPLYSCTSSGQLRTALANRAATPGSQASSSTGTRYVRMPQGLGSDN